MLAEKSHHLADFDDGTLEPAQFIHQLLSTGGQVLLAASLTLILGGKKGPGTGGRILGTGQKAGLGHGKASLNRACLNPFYGFSCHSREETPFAILNAGGILAGIG